MTNVQNATSQLQSGNERIVASFGPYMILNQPKFHLIQGIEARPSRNSFDYNVRWRWTILKRGSSIIGCYERNSKNGSGCE